MTFYRELKPLLLSVLDIAKEVGQQVWHIYQQGQFEQALKADLTPLTSADMIAHQMLTQKLSELTPNIPVLSEEDSDIAFKTRQSWSYYWLVDPLDGTREFISGTGQFTTTIALISDHQPIMGVVYYPEKDTYFYASQSQGAFKKTALGKAKRLFVKAHNKHDTLLTVTLSQRQNKQKTLKCFSTPWQCQLKELGSASLKSCLVAEGGADCYLRLGQTGEWDTAAVQCIVEEAGGMILDLNWQPLSYNMRETLINPNFIVMGDSSLPWKDILCV